jgi:hypothetical protein
MYFFAFNASENDIKTTDLSLSGLDSLFEDIRITNEMKVEMFPLARNSIMVRFENIGDLYTSSKIAEQNIDVDQFSRQLFALVNP